jgi:hypothetical protein
VPVKKKPIEAKADRQVSRIRRPKAEKKRAKKTSTLNLPPEVEEQVRIHGCENTLRAFVAALGSLQNSVSALKSGLAKAFDSHSTNHSPKYERARYAFAFRTISTFLKGIGIVSYEKRFYRLALALDDLNRGIVDPLLEPIKTGGTKKCFMDLVCTRERSCWHFGTPQGGTDPKRSRSTGGALFSEDKGAGRTVPPKSRFYGNENPWLVRRFQQRPSNKN